MNLPTPVSGTPKRGLPRTSGRLAGSILASLRSALSDKVLGADVVDHAGQAAQPALVVDQAWFFLTLTTVADQFHILLSG